MRTSVFSAIAAMVLLVFASAASATIINLNGQDNIAYYKTGALTGDVQGTAYSQTFGAGTYSISFVQDMYTAFSRWNNEGGCDDGASCRQGWENSAVISLGTNGENVFFFGDGGAKGGYGPLDEGGYFATADSALEHADIYSLEFTLESAQTLYFFINDNNTNDNRGGISLLIEDVLSSDPITDVPGPANWLLLLVGLCMLGMTVAYRRQTNR